MMWLLLYGIVVMISRQMRNYQPFSRLVTGGIGVVDGFLHHTRGAGIAFFRLPPRGESKRQKSGNHGQSISGRTGIAPANPQCVNDAAITRQMMRICSHCDFQSAANTWSSIRVWLPDETTMLSRA
ncbi:MAG TPA: hypothetical protein O0X23_04830 [Methanocorpusculum sp.]|nr:hypothetical protein [Methanocorpusculum sp.]